MEIIPTPFQARTKRARDASTYTGSLTVTMQPFQGGPRTVEIGEFSRRRKVSGRNKRRTLRRAHQLIRSTWTPSYLRASGSNEFCTIAGGYFKLYNHLQNNLVNHLPVHIWNVNPGYQAHTPQYTNLSLVIGNDPNVGFTPLTHPDGLGGTTSNFTIESEATDNARNFNQIHHKWTDIRLLCYGTTKIPIKYDVMLCSFPEEMHNPAWIYDNLASHTSTLSSTVNFWQNFAQPFVRSPVDTSAAYQNTNRIIRVIKRESFVLQSSTTVEGSAGIPHMKEIKWFHRMDRVNNHRYRPTGHLTAPQYASSLYEVDADQVYANPQWKERIFLVIRAYSARTSSGVGPVWDIAKNPSYDLTIRHRMDTPI